MFHRSASPSRRRSSGGHQGRGCVTHLTRPLQTAAQGGWHWAAYGKPGKTAAPPGRKRHGGHVSPRGVLCEPSRAHQPQPRPHGLLLGHRPPLDQQFPWGVKPPPRLPLHPASVWLLPTAWPIRHPSSCQAPCVASPFTPSGDRSADPGPDSAGITQLPVYTLEGKRSEGFCVFIRRSSEP